MVRMFTPPRVKPTNNKMEKPHKDDKQTAATEKVAATAANESYAETSVKKSTRRERLTAEKKAVTEAESAVESTGTESDSGEN